MQPQEQSVIGSSSSEEMIAEKELSDSSSLIFNAQPSVEGALQGKPKRYTSSVLEFVYFHLLVSLSD